MNFKTKVIITLICIMFYLMGLTVSTEESNYSHQSQLDKLNNSITEVKKQVNGLTSVVNKISDNTRYYAELEQVNYLDKQVEKIKTEIKRIKKTSRGETGERRIMTVTAYSKDSCGKSPSHQQYGITASGKMVRDWYTIAAGPEIPMGTKIYIPYFKDKPNKGIFVKQDTGPKIKVNCIDVYMESTAECFKFGRRKLEVYVLD